MHKKIKETDRLSGIYCKRFEAQAEGVYDIPLMFGSKIDNLVNGDFYSCDTTYEDKLYRFLSAGGTGELFFKLNNTSADMNLNKWLCSPVFMLVLKNYLGSDEFIKLFTTNIDYTLRTDPGYIENFLKNKLSEKTGLVELDVIRLAGTINERFDYRTFITFGVDKSLKHGEVKISEPNIYKWLEFKNDIDMKLSGERNALERKYLCGVYDNMIEMGEVPANIFEIVKSCLYKNYSVDEVKTCVKDGEDWLDVIIAGTLTSMLMDECSPEQIAFAKEKALHERDVFEDVFASKYFKTIRETPPVMDMAGNLRTDVYIPEMYL